jgi:diguanylate cyclase (GGDEF)-like protein
MSVSDDLPVIDRALPSFPLPSWLFLILGAGHATASAVDLVPGNAGPFAAVMDATVPVAVVLGLAAHRWAPAGLVRQLTPLAYVLGIVLAASASGVRGGVSGHPWFGADVVLAVLAALALPGLPSFAAALAAAELSWAATLVAGLRVVPDSGESRAGWLLLALFVVFVPVTVVGLRWNAVWLRSEADAAVQRAVQQAVTDALTGANNRRGLERLAAPMIERARRRGEAVHCLFVDVDGLRTVNERLGRAHGDAVLRAVHEALVRSVRGTDAVARWSGDQFVVIGPDTGTSPLEMERRVRGQLDANPPVPTDVWTAGVSIGSATLVPWDDGNLDSLFGRAEEDMLLRRSLRRQGRIRSRRDGSRSSAGAADQSTGRRSNPPTVPPVATEGP